jgi:hypothetical protein
MLMHAEMDWTLGDGNVLPERVIELLHGVDAAIISSLPLTATVLQQMSTL